MLLGIQAGEDRHMGGQGRRVLRDGTLEDDRPLRQATEERRRLALIAVQTEVIRPQRVQRDQDVAAGRADHRAGCAPLDHKQNAGKGSASDDDKAPHPAMLVQTGSANRHGRLLTMNVNSCIILYVGSQKSLTSCS